MILEEYYKFLCAWKSDINEHLPTLREYADGADHITEFGMWMGHSTAALLCGKPKILISYDILPQCRHTRKFLKSLAPKTDLIFKEMSSVIEPIEETDLLFIDSWHVYDHLKKELKQSDKVRKYIICHDTVLYGEKDSGRNGPGLMPAVTEFLQTNPNWQMVANFGNCNGLTILKRRNLA